MSDRQPVLTFGDFRLALAERRLEQRGRTVKIGDRALDILITLLSRPGEVIEKRELIDRVWPGLEVEDGNLRVNMTSLRAVLGDGRGDVRYVTNVHGRGYCFVAPVGVEEAAPPEAPPAPARPAATPGLPPRLTRMVGREAVVEEILEELGQGRFVSLVGPGGIGKTTVAVAAGHAYGAATGEEARFVDLGSLTDESLVPGAVASALDFKLQGDLTAGLLSVLRERGLLLVFDSCERVIGAAAILAEQIVRNCPSMRVLATSREPLRAEGEHVYRLASLAFPEAGAPLSAEQALAYPAVQLLVDRATAAQHLFKLGDGDADIAADICRRLGGIALAMELAGGRIGVIGLRETAAQLDSELALRWPGRRTALPRHQTLNATLDWSYSVLTDQERTVLRRLSIFAGSFGLEGATEIASGAEAAGAIDPAQVADDLASLVAKSLVAVEPGDQAARFRLLDTTRAYGRAKLAASGEMDGVARRHARRLARRWDRGRGVPLLPKVDLAVFKIQLGDIREALAWCFGADGDVVCGARLAAGAAPVLLELAQWADCERWTGHVLAHPRIAAEPDPLEPHTRLELLVSHAQAVLLMERQDGAVKASLETAIAQAELQGEPHYHLRALLSLHRHLCRNEDYAASLVVAQRLRVAAEAAANVEIDVLAELASGMSHHFLGRQAECCAELRSGLRRMASSEELKTILFSHQSDFHAWVTLARSLWVRGLPDQAAAAARRSIQEAERLKAEGALSVSAIWVIQVHFWSGDLVEAERMASELLDLTRDHPNAPLRDLGLALRGELLLRGGDPEAGTPLLRRYLDLVQAAGRYSLMPTMSYVEGALALGMPAEAEAALEWAMTKAEATSYRLYRPEMLRLRGEILAATGSRAAEEVYRQAIACAHEQDALSWELRATLSLSRLLRDQGRDAEARNGVEAALSAFTEGGWSRDHVAARAFLAADADARPPLLAEKIA